MAKGDLGRIYRDGEIVMRQGEQDGYMHVVQEGEVEVFAERDGQELPLAVRGKGEILGEMAVFDGTPHSATVRARGDVRILTVDKRGFLRRIQQDPSLAFHMLQNLSLRVRDLSSKLMRYEEQRARLEGGLEPGAAGSPPAHADAAPGEGQASVSGPAPAILQALDPGSRSRSALWLRSALRGAVCIGLAAAVLHASTALSGHLAALHGVVLAVLVLMGAEYALRLYAAARTAAGPGRALAERSRYALSLPGVVDLAAVAPMAVAIAVGARSDTVAILSIFWVLKLARYRRDPAVLGP